MVMNNKQPKTKCDSAAHHPPENNQMILPMVCKQPPPLLAYTILLPKGHATNPANLKHCNPKGISMMVMHKTKPPNTYAIAEMNPPKINHIKLPIRFIVIIILNKVMQYKSATQVKHH